MSAAADILVLKDGRRLGPYRVEEALVLVDEGQLSYEDVCMRSGDSRTIRLREALDWDETPPATSDPTKKEVFFPDPMPAPKASPAQKEQEEQVDVKRGQVVYRGHPSLMNYSTSIGLSTAVTVAGIFLWDMSGFIVFGGLCLALLTYIHIAYERATRVYLVTPERIETIFGFVTKSSNEVRVRDIRAINVKTVGLKGWLGIGDVEFASAGSSQIEVLFRGVWKPHRLKQLVRAVQDQD